jgi:hypothetical protein
MNKEEFWTKHKQLMLGIFYKDIIEYSTFVHFKSVFKEAVYNFIVPTVDQSSFNWKAAEDIIKIENESGVEISYYIPEHFQDNYNVALIEKGFNFVFKDTYVVKQMQELFDLGIDDFAEITDEHKDYFIKKVGECFPDYENNEEYCNYCIELAKTPGSKVNKNIGLKFNNHFYAFGSLLYSTEIGIGFMHNDCTVQEFRRRGLHHEIIKLRANLAYESGVTVVYSNVQEGELSYNSYLKLGFEPMLKFSIYSKINK